VIRLLLDANNIDLTQFDRWYSQAGTPVVDVEEVYDDMTKVYTLKLSQYTPSTPNQPKESKQPQIIPVAVGLLDRETGLEVVPTTILKFDKEEQSFSFRGIATKPIPSLLRDFSAPVKLRFAQSESDLAFLMVHDTDSFNRWDAGNRLCTKILLELVNLPSVDDIASAALPTLFVDAIGGLLDKVLVSTPVRLQLLPS
jgi:aminopeptidase N